VRWSQSLTVQRRKRDLKNRMDALEREVAEAKEKADALVEAVALNNLGATHADLGEWQEAYDAYLRAAETVPADASADDRATPWGNAALAARRLKEWDKATLCGVRVDALAAELDSDEYRTVAEAALALVRKALGKEAFAPVLDAAIAELPAEARVQVRRDLHADPTFRKTEA